MFNKTFPVDLRGDGLLSASRNSGLTSTEQRNLSMTPLLFALGFALSSLAQGKDAIAADEASYQSETYQRCWREELIWKFDDLPTRGGVPESRIPYSGYDYPDSAGGTIFATRKYDIAFHQARNLATAFEMHDTTAITEPTMERRGPLRLRRIQVERTPGWHGHCNGWTAAAIRHAEPQTSVRRGRVTFTPADIKALLAEIYMYNAADFLGGDETDEAMNPGLLHVGVANWIGRSQHPVAMDATLGPEVWNYPIYAFSTSSAKRQGGRQVEVRLNTAYVTSTNREYDKSPRLKRIKAFHYLLDLDEDGKITGGRYYSDSARVDMLWIPLRAAQGGQAGNERGNPHLDVDEVLSLWRDSVPEELRQKWGNIDEDRSLAEVSEEDDFGDRQSVGDD